jgi:hypothetical protein
MTEFGLKEKLVGLQSTRPRTGDTRMSSINADTSSSPFTRSSLSAFMNAFRSARFPLRTVSVNPPLGRSMDFEIPMQS